MNQARLLPSAKTILLLGVGSVIALLLSPEAAVAQSFSPAVTINTTSGSEVSSTEVFSGLKLALLLSTLVFLPSFLLSSTSFLRIAIVLSLTRQALGTNQTPPTQVIVGFSMFLTFAVMGPTFQQIYDESLKPYTEDQITHTEALDKAFSPLRDFMLRYTRERDLQLFVEISGEEPPASPADLGPTVVIPAFIISELNTAFQIAFLIFMPFLVLDMIVSSVLTSMSMITLPPTVVSLPIKLMLFVLIDGWYLIVGNLIRSYQV